MSKQADPAGAVQLVVAASFVVLGVLFSVLLPEFVLPGLLVVVLLSLPQAKMIGKTKNAKAQACLFIVQDPPAFSIQEILEFVQVNDLDPRAHLF